MIRPPAFRLRSWQQLTLAALALEIYRKEHGPYPGTLQPLVVDQIIAELPSNPYEAAPLEYLASETLLRLKNADGAFVQLRLAGEDSR